MVEKDFKKEKLKERLVNAQTQKEADDIGALLIQAEVLEGIEELKKRPVNM